MKNQKPPTAFDPLVWGVYDTRDKCWMGQEDGPLRFSGDVRGVSAHKRAQAAASILNVQFRRWGLRARPIPEGINRHAGTVEAKLTFRQAMKHLERGGY